MADEAAVIPRIRTQGLESVGETAFALLDALWLGPVGLALFDRDLRFVQVNDALARLHGLAPAEHPGRTLRDLFDPAGREVQRVEAAMREAIETARPVLNVAVSGKLPDGAPREWLCSYFPVVASGGEPRGVCAVVSDATDDRAREAALVLARNAAERAARRLALLQNVTAALAAANEPEEVAEAFVAQAPALLDARTAVVRVEEEDGHLRILAQRGLPEDMVARLPVRLADVPLVADAYRRGEPLFVGSPQALAARAPALLGDARRIGEAWAVLPLEVRGRAVGTLTVTFERPREFDLEERGLLLALGEQCAQALDRARLRRAEREAAARAERATDRVRRLQAVTAALSQARTAEDVGAAMVLQAHEALGVLTALALVGGPDDAELQLLAALGFDAPGRQRFERVPVDASLPIAQAVRTGVPVIVPRAAEALDRYPLLADLPAAVRNGAVAAFPLRAGGAVIGALAMGFAEPPEFDAEGRAFLQTVADQCAQALERALLFDAERRARGVLSAVLENAPVGIGFWDPSFQFRMLNQLLADMNGLTVEAHLGKTPRELLPGLPMDEIEAAWRGILAGGPPMLDVTIEGETPAAPGKRRWWKESFYPVRADRDVLGIGAIVREVTHEREAEEFQKNVLGIVSHDLRNPLSTMVLSARLLGRTEEAPAQVKELTRRIVRSAERMERIVEVLLDYTRVRSGQGIPIRPVECRLDSLLLALVEETEAAHPGRRVALQVDGDAAGLWDPARLTQVIANLLGNAVRHSPPTAPLEAGVRGTDGEVELWVRNGGVPIPADVLPRLFEPFRRASAEDAPAGREGLGLGLFIARAIAEAHGGRMEVRSTAAEGTVFTLRLPRRTAAATVR